MTASQTTDTDMGMKAVIKRIHENASYVDIGIQPDEEETLLVIAAANEFGATIHHPGGTPYGYNTKKDAEAGKVQFLKKGAGFLVLGETKPHIITIPARPYIRSTVDENEQVYAQVVETLSKQMLDGVIGKHKALGLLGQKVEADIKRKIITLRTPPNAKSTIRKKGSDNPLVDTGLLGNSVRYVVGSDAKVKI